MERKTRSSAVPSGGSMETILGVQLSPSDVLGAIKVGCQVGGIREYRLKWEEPHKAGVSEGYVRLFTLSEVTEGKEIRVGGQAAITADWDGDVSEATITTWTVPWRLVMESHVFLASIFEVCRIVQVKSFAVGAKRVGADMPTLEEVSKFTLTFDVQTQGAIAQPANSKDMQELRKWVEASSFGYGQKTGGKKEIGWSFSPADAAWKTDLVGFVARPAEKKPTCIYFAKVDTLSALSSTTF